MANERTKCPLTDDQIKHMVNRFLEWKLPDDFTPDAGISFNPILRSDEPWPEVWPVGTNLLSATQAEAMIRYMVEGIQHGGVCLWCGFSTTKGSLDELADAIYAHLGGCDASPVPAEQAAHAATKEELRKADEALVQHGYHRQGIPDLGVPHCSYDPEVGIGCDCGFQPLLDAALARAQHAAILGEKEE